MTKLSSGEIDNILFTRLQNTEDAYGKLNVAVEEYDDILQMVYCKYYLDFSSAIEAVIRNIQRSIYDNDKFAKKKLGYESEKRSQFLEACDIGLIINKYQNDDSILDVHNFYAGKVSIIKDSFYKQIGENKKIIDYESFQSFYGIARDQRNRVAHSLKTEFKFDNSTLFKFMLTYYYLLKFYQSLERDEDNY